MTTYEAAIKLIEAMQERERIMLAERESNLAMLGGLADKVSQLQTSASAVVELVGSRIAETRKDIERLEKLAAAIKQATT